MNAHAILDVHKAVRGFRCEQCSCRHDNWRAAVRKGKIRILCTNKIKRGLEGTIIIIVWNKIKTQYLKKHPFILDEKTKDCNKFLPFVLGVLGKLYLLYQLVLKSSLVY